MILWRECGGRWVARGQALSTPPVAIRPDGHFGPMLSPAGLPYNPVNTNTNTYTQAQTLIQALGTPPVAILIITSDQCCPKPPSHITPYDHDGDDGDDDDEEEEEADEEDGGELEEEPPGRVEARRFFDF